jgi:hypothetical protein
MTAKVLSETTLHCYQRVCFNKQLDTILFESGQLHVTYNQFLFHALVACL